MASRALVSLTDDELRVLRYRRPEQGGSTSARRMTMENTAERMEVRELARRSGNERDRCGAHRRGRPSCWQSPRRATNGNGPIAV